MGKKTTLSPTTVVPSDWSSDHSILVLSFTTLSHQLSNLRPVGVGTLGHSSLAGSGFPDGTVEDGDEDEARLRSSNPVERRIFGYTQGPSPRYEEFSILLTSLLTFQPVTQNKGSVLEDFCNRINKDIGYDSPQDGSLRSLQTSRSESLARVIDLVVQVLDSRNPGWHGPNTGS